MLFRQELYPLRLNFKIPEGVEVMWDRTAHGKNPAKLLPSFIACCTIRPAPPTEVYAVMTSGNLDINNHHVSHLINTSDHFRVRQC